MRKFNLEGPVEAERHYCIPPLDRVNLGEILERLADRRYFVLHAPRQTGKTSTLLALQDRLNAAGAYRCLYVNVEGGQAAKEDTARAMQTILGELGTRARRVLQDDFVERSKAALTAEYGPDACLAECLTRWAEREARLLVLLLDEIDALVGDTLISVLRQLRARYDMRPGGFSQSVILCGVRDVCDCHIYSSREGANVQGGSAFNIKAESLRLGNFCKREVQELLGQYIAECGQAFELAAVERLWELSCGQPWLVNALAYEACFRAGPGADPAQPVGVPAIEAAKEALIVRRVTHLDQLADKLREERVRRVILPMLAGSHAADYSLRDLEYVRDLGLVAAKDEVRMANPVYAEVVPRELTAALRARRGGAAVGAACLPAARGQQRRPYRARVRGGPRAHGLVGRVGAQRGGGQCARASMSSSARCAGRKWAGKACCARGGSRRPSTWTAAGRKPGTWWFSTCGRAVRGASACSAASRNRANCRSLCGGCSPCRAAAVSQRRSPWQPRPALYAQNQGAHILW